MSDRHQSPLERALIDMDERRLGPDDFLEMFLATEIFVPTPPPDEPVEREFITDETESFSLITLDVDGQETLPAFDDLDRFREWVSVSDSPVGYMGVLAETLIAVIDPNIAVAFFAGAEGSYLFEPEALEQIRNWQPVPPDGAYGVGPGTPVRVSDIEVPPDGLIEAMVPALQSLRGGVREARLIEFAERDRPGSERLVVALTLDVDSKDQLQKVVDSLSQEVKPVLGDIGYLDFMNLSEWEFAADIQDSIPPFFAWREE